MAHLWTQSVKISPLIICHTISPDVRNRLVRNAFTAGRRAWYQLKMAKEEDAQWMHKANNARTVLRTMMVYGRSKGFSLPDDENLIWYGDLRWRHSDGLAPSWEQYDWLVDYLVEKSDSADDATKDDALLALSSMCALGYLFVVWAQPDLPESGMLRLEPLLMLETN